MFNYFALKFQQINACGAGPSRLFAHLGTIRDMTTTTTISPPGIAIESNIARSNNNGYNSHFQGLSVAGIDGSMWQLFFYYFFCK